jgi:hypothetical protein
MLRFREMAEEAGRDPASLTVTLGGARRIWLYCGVTAILVLPA